MRLHQLLPTVLAALALLTGACSSSERSFDVRAVPAETARRLYMDVHRVGPGQVRAEDVAAAHLEDLAIQGAHGVDYRSYWVDESEGTIFCLVEAPDAPSATDVHREAHGLLADEIGEVLPGILPAEGRDGARLYMDVHRMGAGGVHAADVAEAHRKDLAVQSRFGVRFLEYWVDETSGRIYCLAEAPDREALLDAHAAAHGLLPDEVHEVVAGR